MRYFIHLAYNGAKYHGWQRQPTSISVQEVLELAVSTIINKPTAITGCGRTDTGVHASQYYAHFDIEGDLPKAFQFRLNNFVPPDIIIHQVFLVEAQQHSRFDAHYRAYAYHLSWNKDPFRQTTLLHYPIARKIDPKKVQEAAALILNYDEFTPFCKTNSDAKTMRCELYQSEWQFEENEWIYHIAANRFLRGMVRLIVGMCLSVGQGKMSLESVKIAMDNQSHLKKSLSVEPQGLFLVEVKYPFIDHPSKKDGEINS